MALTILLLLWMFVLSMGGFYYAITFRISTFGFPVPILVRIALFCMGITAIIHGMIIAEEELGIFAQYMPVLQPLLAVLGVISFAFMMIGVYQGSRDNNQPYRKEIRRLIWLVISFFCIFGLILVVSFFMGEIKISHS